MEEKFVAAWMANREKAARMGVRLRPMDAADAMFSLPSSDDNVAEVTQDSFYSNIYTDGTRRWSGAYVIVTNR